SEEVKSRPLTLDLAAAEPLKVTEVACNPHSVRCNLLSSPEGRKVSVSLDCSALPPGATPFGVRVSGWLASGEQFSHTVGGTVRLAPEVELSPPVVVVTAAAGANWEETVLVAARSGRPLAIESIRRQGGGESEARVVARDRVSLSGSKPALSSVSRESFIIRVSVGGMSREMPLDVSLVP
ncbi:hypothetical protein R5W23_002326, partial [Gemmata sp. JC673]